MSRENRVAMVNAARDKDYITFKKNFDADMLEKLDGKFEEKTAEIYGGGARRDE